MCICFDLEEKTMAKNCCERLPTCPFYRAVQDADEILDVLNEYVHVYCCGPFKGKCYRNKYQDEHGGPPADNISPTGDDFHKYLKD